MTTQGENKVCYCRSYTVPKQRQTTRLLGPVTNVYRDTSIADYLSTKNVFIKGFISLMSEYDMCTRHTQGMDVIFTSFRAECSFCFCKIVARSPAVLSTAAQLDWTPDFLFPILIGI